MLDEEESAVPFAIKKFKDERVSQYWDGKEKMADDYKRVLNIDQKAWDIYLLYPPDAEWKDEPPKPNFWMHQLNLDPKIMLNGDTMAKEVKNLLETVNK